MARKSPAWAIGSLKKRRPDDALAARPIAMRTYMGNGSIDAIRASTYFFLCARINRAIPTFPRLSPALQPAHLAVPSEAGNAEIAVYTLSALSNFGIRRGFIAETVCLFKPSFGSQVLLWPQRPFGCGPLRAIKRVRTPAIGPLPIALGWPWPPTSGPSRYFSSSRPPWSVAVPPGRRLADPGAHVCGLSQQAPGGMHAPGGCDRSLPGDLRAGPGPGAPDAGALPARPGPLPARHAGPAPAAARPRGPARLRGAPGPHAGHPVPRPRRGRGQGVPPLGRPPRPGRAPGAARPAPAAPAVLEPGARAGAPRGTGPGDPPGLSRSGDDRAALRGGPARVGARQAARHRPAADLPAHRRQRWPGAARPRRQAGAEGDRSLPAREPAAPGARACAHGGAVPDGAGLSDVAPVVRGPDQALRPRRRDPRPGLSAPGPAHLRHTPAVAWRGAARHSGHAGPRLDQQHRGLYAPGAAPSAALLPSAPPPGPLAPCPALPRARRWPVGHYPLRFYTDRLVEDLRQEAHHDRPHQEHRGGRALVEVLRELKHAVEDRGQEKRPLVEHLAAQVVDPAQAGAQERAQRGQLILRQLTLPLPILVLAGRQAGRGGAVDLDELRRRGLEAAQGGQVYHDALERVRWGWGHLRLRSGHPGSVPRRGRPWAAAGGGR